MELNIDKTGWKSYRFDEFAQNISQRVEPKQTDLEVYVGLEHLDPDSLHIKRNGTPADVEGTKLKFYNGDVIFGKRRAYQRKAALAETDGICSAHAMVLRANTKLIDERLFPFFFHSKVFQDIAVKISVGGLSPTINWKDLAKQEFLLPPKDQQARLAELLWAADEVVEREMEVKERLENYRSTSFIDFFDKKLSRFENMKIKDIAQKITSGGTPDSKNEKYYNGNIPWLNTKEVDFNDITKTEKMISELGLKNSSAKWVEKESIIVAMYGATAGKTAYTLIDLTTNQACCNINVDKQIANSRYLYYYLQHCYCDLRDSACGAAQPNLSLDFISNYYIKLPSIKEQKLIVKDIVEIIEMTKNFAIQISKSQQLKQGLINEIF